MTVLYKFYYYYAPVPNTVGVGIKRRCCLTSVCLTSVCLSCIRRA